MSACEIIDTSPSFLSAWDEAPTDVDAQIEGWLKSYRALYLELLQKQLDESTKLNEDRQVIASERFPPALLERMVFV